ncbi:peptidoglycan-binding protein [Variovorax sp. J2P1-59]|uniref:peptidoglycan-binding protein n=1 Tax=Variovorax flavidus TaxID=3053501 RepID=UPI00257587DD|nr:peptidoglycan-binding protein [Variovorax sp. J2P1-59]MDM0075702.1 peptidoglycan-binding protein [Variovorax sp. J2P1-59]
MATETRSGFEKWKDGIDKADADWDGYDKLIRETVRDYNWHLRKTPGYRELNWQLVKAMIWTETGAGHREWNVRPIRIGVLGDKGLPALLSRREGSELVVPYSLVGREVQTVPRENIRAGVGYMLMRMAEYGFASIPDRDHRIFEVTVGPGDHGLERVARRCGSTSEILMKLNPAVRAVNPGQVLKCQKATVQKVITGWRSFDYTTIALRYNGNGDPNYASKLEYSFNVIRSRAQ